MADRTTTDDLDLSKIHIPEGFPPLTQPTKDENKFAKEKIKIEYVQPDDILEYAAICYEAFPDTFWDAFETPDRPSLEERTKRLAKHFLPWLSMPGYHAIKAVNTDTGEMMGIASWMENGKFPIYPTSYPMFPNYKFPSTYIPCTWRDDLVIPMGFDKTHNWSSEQVKEMYAHHSQKWFPEFEKYDIGRLAEMGETPHWYLAPLCVKEKYWARGVGKALSMWGIERADSATPPMPCVLEAFPNARPVYYHLGFRPTAHRGVCKETQLVRPAKGCQF
ncbi:MAG: hypothetical protein Q9162_006388 [Coniocarpon cinnabarinum]